jgi:hypothetical protein
MLINLVFWHWPEASWLVGSGGFVATFVDIDTLVVRQVVAARLFELSWVVPPVDVTSHSDFVFVFRLLSEVFAISVLGPVDFSIAVWSGDQSWVGLGKAPEHVSFLAETFNDPAMVLLQIFCYFGRRRMVPSLEPHGKQAKNQSRLLGKQHR